LASIRKDKEALRQSEQRWATTLASIGDGVVATNVSGRVSFMNTVAEALTGWKTDEANQKPISEVFNIINETTRQKAENPVDKVLQQRHYLQFGQPHYPDKKGWKRNFD